MHLGSNKWFIIIIIITKKSTLTEAAGVTLFFNLSRPSEPRRGDFVSGIGGPDIPEHDRDVEAEKFRWKADPNDDWQEFTVKEPRRANRPM